IFKEMFPEDISQTSFRSTELNENVQPSSLSVLTRHARTRHGKNQLTPMNDSFTVHVVNCLEDLLDKGTCIPLRVGSLFNDAIKQFSSRHKFHHEVDLILVLKGLD